MNNIKEKENFINNLTFVLNGQIQAQNFKEEFNPNYTDINGNGCFHFLAEYSFESFCFKNIKLNKNEAIVDFKKYNDIKNQYIKHISFFTNLLLEFNCDIFSPNKYNENPLHLCIINKNFIIAKEYFKIQQNLGIYNEEDYFNILNLAIKNGNSFDKDFIELIMMIISTTDENNNIVFNNSNLNKENNNYEFTPLISLCKNFSENIYDIYNKIVKIKSMEFINKDNNNYINTKKDQNIINIIKKNSFEELNHYINNYFYPLIIQLIEQGAKLQIKKASGLVYLMSFPFIQNLSTFVKENNININYQDEYGNTLFMNLINNKECIIQISKDIYDNAFNYFINDENIKINKYNNNKAGAFYLCLIKEYYIDAKIIYEKFKNLYILNFNSDILSFIVKYLNKKKRIVDFFNIFKNEINLNQFNYTNKRTLLHYICQYLSDDSINFDIFKEIILLLNNYKIDMSKKDEFNRNILFYFFIDEKEEIKTIDPIKKLEYCVKISTFNLNDKDIFGKNLLSYAIQSKALNCINYLINSGIDIISENNNENSIYSSCLLIGDLKLFIYLYNKNKNPKIFNNKIYTKNDIKIINKSDVINSLEKKEKIETLYDFLNRDSNLSLQSFPFHQNLNKNQFLNFHKIKLEKEFNYFNFLYDEVIKILDDYTYNIIIKIENDFGNNNNNNYSIFEINEDSKINNIKSNFNLNYSYYINERLNSEREVISENLFRYCLSKNYDELCKFMINEKYNLISICYDLILFHKFNDINEYIKKLLSENNYEQNKLIT